MPRGSRDRPAGALAGIEQGNQRSARRLTAAGLAAAVPAAVGERGRLVRAADARRRGARGREYRGDEPVRASLLARGPRLGPALRLVGLASVAVSGLAGGHISFRLAGRANHAEQVPHLVEPGWQHLMTSVGLPEGKPVRELLGEIPGGGRPG